MRKRQCVILLGVIVACVAARAVAQVGGTFTGGFTVYSDGPPDFQPPTAQNVNISISMQGRAARDLYEALGQTGGVKCVATERRRGDIVCRISDREHICAFGLDLKTGKSRVGTAC